MGHFQSDIIIKDSDRSKEDVLTQVERVMDFVRKHINKEIIITGEAQNTQRWQYPLEAIREIVMNMIIHRDYRSASDSIVKVWVWHSAYHQLFQRRETKASELSEYIRRFHGYGV